VAKRGRFRSLLPEKESVRVRTRAGGVKEEHGLIWRKREIPRDHHRYETLPAATEHQDHQGPLRGPSQNDTRLFPVEGDLRYEWTLLGYHLSLLTL